MLRTDATTTTPDDDAAMALVEQRGVLVAVAAPIRLDGYNATGTRYTLGRARGTRLPDGGSACPVDDANDMLRMAYRHALSSGGIVVQRAADVLVLDNVASFAIKPEQVY